MQNSIFLARLIGPFLLIAGLAVLVNRDSFRALGEEFLSSRSLLFLSSLITLPAGLAIVLTHSVWTADWRVLITLLGWLSTIGGAVRLLVPDVVVRVGRTKIRNTMMPFIGGGLWAALGLILCFFGYR